MKRACAALSVDAKNPCGAHGYAVRPHISGSLNAATRECYKFGGKECGIQRDVSDVTARRVEHGQLAEVEADVGRLGWKHPARIVSMFYELIFRASIPRMFTLRRKEMF